MASHIVRGPVSQHAPSSRLPSVWWWVRVSVSAVLVPGVAGRDDCLAKARQAAAGEAKEEGEDSAAVVSATVSPPGSLAFPHRRGGQLQQVSESRGVSSDDACGLLPPSTLVPAHRHAWA